MGNGLPRSGRSDAPAIIVVGEIIRAQGTIMATPTASG
jgi:hypothetical protein